MALILRTFYDKYLDYMQKHADHRLDHLYFMSIFQVSFITVVYWVFVNKIGPRFMKNREPYNLRRIMQIYNLLQIIANFFLVWKSAPIFFTVEDYSKDWGCMRPNKNGNLTIIYCSYLYYLLKISDYMDTIFMVLRKNFRQITFLHVYHHILMAMGCYYGAHFNYGGHCVLLGVLNSAVHVVMYSYYFLCSLDPELKKSLWWKKHITHIQLLQFAVLIIHFTRALMHPNCNNSVPLMWFCLMQAIVMIILFSNFYIKTYIQAPKAKTS